MPESPLGVLVAAPQDNQDTQLDFEKLVSRVASGEVKGVLINDAPAEDLPPAAPSHRIRRGAVRGAGVGFILGLAPLMASTVMGAGIGAVLARASELRLEGSAPRIRFARRRT
jgi:hypothetical protein